MKKLFTATLGVAMMLLVANAAFAQAFSKYPRAGCPDTLSIVRLKQLLNTADPCAPQTGAGTAPGDTVNGVGGIITGFDEKPTGYDIYIQHRQGGPYSGIDVFTHGTNLRTPYGFNRGDSIVVEFARVANFQGDIEVMSPNNNFSAPNIILSKRSSGNPLPPIFNGNTTDFNELPTNTTFQPYISALVKLVGPVRVARVGDVPTLTTTGGVAFGAIVVRNAAPSDSVFIDFGKLSTVAPPPLGTVITSITGIGNMATRGYRIMPRDADDIVDAVPPNVIDAYPTADNRYRVVFDRAVTPASATNTANYTLESFGTVSAAVMDGSSAVILTVPTLREVSEKVKVNHVVGQANGVAMTVEVEKEFIAGVLSCAEASAPNPDSLSANPCHDKSKYAGPLGQFINGQFGPRSSITGIVVGIFGNLYYMEDSPPTNNLIPEKHRGITVFAPPTALTLGRRYILAGNGQEFYSEHEFVNIGYVSDQGNPGVPAPINLPIEVASYDTCDADQEIHSARDYLSELVKLQNVKVVQRFNPAPTNGFHVAGPGPTFPDTMFCENLNTVLGPNNVSSYPAVGTRVDVTGVVHYTTSTSSPSFRVCPRSQADIVVKNVNGVDDASTGDLSFAAYPNPARRVNLTFSLPKAAQIDLGVYDLFGRHVATVARGRYEAGNHQKVWNGLNDAGKPVRAGMYFYRLNADGDKRSARTVLITN